MASRSNYPPQEVHIGAAALPGANHLLPAPLPCQDSARAWKDASGAVALAVADGHGDAKYPHSDVGATLAAELFISEARALVPLLRSGLESRDGASSRQWIDQEAGRFRGRLLSEWRRRVNLHHSVWSQYGAMHAGAAADTPRRDETPIQVPYPKTEINSDVKLYATTLLGVIAFDEWLLLFQRGDGAIVLAGTDREELAFPLSEEKQFSSATASMVTPSSSRPLEPGELVWDFPVLVRNRISDGIRWVCIASDGVIDAFGPDDQKIQKYLARQLLGLADEGRWPECSEEGQVLRLSSFAGTKALGFRNLWSKYVVPQLLWRVPEGFTRDDSSMATAWWPLPEWPTRASLTAARSHAPVDADTAVTKPPPASVLHDSSSPERPLDTLGQTDFVPTDDTRSPRSLRAEDET